MHKARWRREVERERRESGGRDGGEVGGRERNEGWRGGGR